MSACPTCDYFGSKVTMTRRLQGGWIKRWRRCLQEDCGVLWTTYEVSSASVAPPEDCHPDFLKEMNQKEVDN